MMGNEKGFTLIELLITVAIIGLLAAAATTAYVGVVKKAARSEAYSNLETLRLLEEQFYAENGRYTVNLGADGDSGPEREANVNDIRTTANNALPGFRPGNDGNFVYWIVQNQALPANPAVPFVPASVTARTPCFVAMARGIAATRVALDVFAIDCDNRKNF